MAHANVMELASVQMAGVATTARVVLTSESVKTQKVLVRSKTLS